MNIEVYFDLLCPWCYIGKRRLSTALKDRTDAHVVWRSFELDPGGGRTPGPTAAEVIARYQSDPARAAARVALIRRLGQAEGLELNLHLARPVNSFDAHRLVHLAADEGRGDAVLERLLHGYHTEGRDLADLDVLRTLAVEAGLAPGSVADLLQGDAFSAEVRADEDRATRTGIRGVPTLVIDGGPPMSAVQDPAALSALLSISPATSRW
ncbi:DsbA family oxidoreductase [Spongiactinospora sp. TRM90649]|uniref:DsbA family oxidoreductase n=1 Tax=Spongiactinospora sp. TRM90649 TaxID=3031114 RepID=UPI0023F8119D|nr:DsbA family oxidoreductase [Spongiactinospora sp. TRM90649]MDF5758658.1 DsbA family oxidoreductase [Spongiactinospora sp. TRM90649]